MTPHVRWIAALAVPMAIAAGAQEPTVVNGRIAARQAGPATAAAFRAALAALPPDDTAWIGYRVPMIPGDRTACCGSWNGSGVSPCRIEPGGARSDGLPAGGRVARIEPSRSLIVLYRAVNRQVERIVSVSDNCEIDAGGRSITWLDGMPVRESLGLLTPFAAADPEGRRPLQDGATAAIALHAGPEADAALVDLVRADRPVAVRRHATFWLGHARGAAGLAALERVLRDDPSAEVRKAGVFGVSQSPEPRAAEVLAGLARQHPDPAVRGEALFWAAQSGMAGAARLARQALDADTSAEVRKRAVFALSQLADDSGVDMLIDVARTHRDPAVRGEAIFWLGQKAGKAAAGAIAERVDADPETEVKKRAIFALSQLPPDQGIPLLLDLARTHANPEVRKQAMFWLGQSKDPRAVDFFAEVLTGRR